MSALDLTARGLALRALDGPIAAERIASGTIDPAHLPAPAWEEIAGKPAFELLASASLIPPAGPRLLYWDEGSNSLGWLTPGSGLSLAGDVLSGAEGSSGSLQWQELAAISPAGTAMAEFTAIPSTCAELSVVFEGVSHDSATNTTLTASLSADGVAFAAATSISTAMAATGAWYGALHIPHCRGHGGVMLVSISNIASSPGQALAGSHTAWRTPGGITALRIMPGAGAFDGGTIRLLAR